MIRDEYGCRLRVSERLLVLTLLVVFVDWIWIVFGRRSIEYSLPIRPVLYVLSNSACLRSLKLFARTCMKKLRTIVRPITTDINLS